MGLGAVATSAFASPTRALAGVNDLSDNRKRVVMLDDGSQDGYIALLALMASSDIDVQAFVNTQGIVDPHSLVFQQNFYNWAQGTAGLGDLPIGTGQPYPVKGYGFPEFIKRQGIEEFWRPYAELFDQGPVPEGYFQDGNQLILDTIRDNAARGEKTTIVSTGSLTDLAGILQANPGIYQHIEAVHIMGATFDISKNKDLENVDTTGMRTEEVGNVGYFPGVPYEGNGVAEFNIITDAIAAQQVFGLLGANNIPAYVTPLNHTNDVSIGCETYERWIQGDNSLSVAAGQLLKFATQEIPSNTDPNAVWDLIAAMKVMHLDSAHYLRGRIDVDYSGKPDETFGQTTFIYDPQSSIRIAMGHNAEYGPEFFHSLFENNPDLGDQFPLLRSNQITKDVLACQRLDILDLKK